MCVPGMSGALVLRGEPGVGKSALLGYAVERAADLQIVRMVAVESEKTLGFAAVHQLLVPFLPAMDRLPEPQRRALGVAFGLVSGPPADPFLVGLAVLTLLADAAEDRPRAVRGRRCAVAGRGVGRRSQLRGSPAAGRPCRDAVRDAGDDGAGRRACRRCRVFGSPACRSRTRASCSRGRSAGRSTPLSRERIVAETGGNPLAVVEAARELTPEQLGGLEPLPEPLPVGHRLEKAFVRRVRGLPADTQRLLLLAAADQPGRGDRLWRAAAALGIPESAAVPAEASRTGGLLAEGAVLPSARPVGGLPRRDRGPAAAGPPSPGGGVRSGARRSSPGLASGRGRRRARRRGRRRAGGGSGAGGEPWWLRRRGRAAGTRGAADAARRSGEPSGSCPQHRPTCSPGRSTELTPCWSRPPEACAIRWSTAQATRLRGRIRFHRGHVAEAASALVGAARRLRTARPARREGRTAVRAGGHRVRRVGLQRCPPGRDRADGG